MPVMGFTKFKRFFRAAGGSASPWPGRSSLSTPSVAPCTPWNGNACSSSSGCWS